jgi:hypothetical protein
VSSLMLALSVILVLACILFLGQCFLPAQFNTVHS